MDSLPEHSILDEPSTNVLGAYIVLACISHNFKGDDSRPYQINTSSVNSFNSDLITIDWSSMVIRSIIKHCTCRSSE